MDQTKRPLQIPPEFSTYAEKHGIFDLYKRLMEQLIINRPSDPIAFLIELLKRDNNDVPQIMVLGPPMAGKHSISKMVCGRLRTAHITPDSLVQEADLKLRDKAEEFINAKKPIPTEVWVSILQERMKLFDCVKKGWVLEGFPQTRQEALALQELGIYPKHCVVLDAPDTVLIERAAGKRIDPKTGDVYHTTFDWPNATDIQSRLEEGPGQSEPEMVDKLVEYHQNTDGILRCYNSAIKVINADQPKADVFSHVMVFLQSQPRSNTPRTPRIILLGPTGAGKGVQASLLANKYNFVKVSCGQLIKQAITRETKAGMAAKPYVEKGMIMPDNIVLNILKERMCQLDCQTRGWVLKGYPYTREQAEQLDKSGLAPNRVFFLDIPNDSVIDRLTQRAIDPVTGDQYHMLYNPPRTQEIKDRLVKHPKDSEEEVRKRLMQYHAYVEELVDYYVDAQHMIADQDPHTVFEYLESMTVKPLPRRY